MYCYVFVDESGNNDFSPTGTKYWVLTSLITHDIHPAVVELYDLKHKLIDLGSDIEYFHASEDRQAVRDEVIAIIKPMTNIRADSLIVDKCMTAPPVRRDDRFYPEMVEQLLKYPFDPRGIDISQYEKVLFFFDRAASTVRKRKALVAGIKKYLAKHLRGVPYAICMHSSTSHHYLQIVDYLSWTMYVKYERGERRPYDELEHLFKSEFQIFQLGHTKWY